MKNKIKINPIKNLSLADEVEMRILQFIKENSLKIGDSIPKELEFADALGVSRTVVREALLRLRTIGIIESRKHKGMILTQPDIIQNFEKVLETNLLGQQTLKDIFELRLILEMGMADLLFSRKTKEENHSSIYTLDFEVAFHGKLYLISNNTTMQRFQNLLLPVFDYVHSVQNKSEIKFEYSSGRFITHRDLLNELKNGSPESFRNAMRQHLEPHFEQILNSVQQISSN